MTEETTQSNDCLTENEKKLKILAIHGYRQNGEVFKQKTGSFRKIVNKWAHFTFITAPHQVITVPSRDKLDEIEINEKSDEYGWFFNREDHTFRGIRKGGPAIGFDTSLQLVEEAFDTFGPFDGILGFSQGGCFVGLLCDLQQRGLTTCKFNFAILVSAFKSGSLPHLKYYNEPIDLKVLNVYGSSDDIIPKEMSEALGEAFKDPVTLVHPGKHYLPASAAQKQVYQEFFVERYSEKQIKLNE